VAYENQIIRTASRKYEIIAILDKYHLGRTLKFRTDNSPAELC
jgi:hypothetical protein